MMMKVDIPALPEAVRVPAERKVLMATTGVGKITWECREKKDMAGQHEWAFVGLWQRSTAATKRWSAIDSAHK